MSARGRPRHPDLLTPREQEVLALVRDGLTNEQIADRLSISFETAKHHVSEILSKLGVSTREEAATWAPEREGARLGRWVLAALGLAAMAAAVAGLGLLAWGLSRAGGGEVAQDDGLSGRIAFVTDRDGNYNLWVVNADGTYLHRLTDFGVNPHITSVQWSADGERIFVIYGPNQDPNADIYSVHRNGTGLTQLTHTPEPEACLVIRGNQIYFARNHTAITPAGSGPPKWETLVANLDGSGERPTGASVCPTDVSPDGEHLLFMDGVIVGHLTTSQVWVSSIDGGDRLRLADKMGYATGATWSPDGRRVAFACRARAFTFLPGIEDNEPPHLCISGPDGSDLEVHTDVGVSGWLLFGTTWSPGGGWLLVHRETSLWIMRPDGSEARSLTGCLCQEQTAAWGP